MGARVGRYYHLAQLRLVRARLALVGSEDPDERLRATSTGRLGSVTWMDDAAVKALRSAGYLSAADLVGVERSDLTRIFGIGKKRAARILDWTDHQRALCQAVAAWNRRRRSTLEAKQIRLEALLA
jgi:hypothetical protein